MLTSILHSAWRRIRGVAPALVFVAALEPLTHAAEPSAVSAAAGFDLVSVDIAPFETVQINQAISFQFSDEVDFSTVNGNTLRLFARDSGEPVVGDYTLSAPNVVRFQPRCPLRADLSDAGLQPGVVYELVVPDVASGQPTVRSLAGVGNGTPTDFFFGPPPVGSIVPLFDDAVATPPAVVIRSNANPRRATRLELGLDAASRVYFEPRVPADAQLGADVPAGFLAPLNLYATPRSRVALLIVIDQMVGLDAANLAPNRVRLEYEASAGNWVALPREVTLDVNCTPTGATLRVTPLGVLPQNRRVRAVLASGFADVVGQALASDLVVGTFSVATATDPGTANPGDAADEIFEGFSSARLEDPTGVIGGLPGVALPRAIWGADGKLEARTFPGTGGPGGDFDWVIGNPDGSPATFILDTTFSVITNATQTATTTVTNGLVDVRSLWVRRGATLVIQGPNPCRILCSGNVPISLPGYPVGTLPSAVLIEGTVKANGDNNRGVVSFNTATIPEPGAQGNAGGGRGGTGNPLTTQSSPQGGPGAGAFDLPGAGGQGGESGFTSLTNDGERRPGGGGGGRFGADQMELTRPNCPDQRIVGLDAENGFNGAANANGALRGVGFTPPFGGARGPRPFHDADASNDFWGTMVTSTGQVIHGELQEPIAGSGGGGGGSCTRTATFPSNPFTNSSDQKGAGGGGGGGSLTILALGDIRVGTSLGGTRGRIECDGGTGGGGENTNGLNRIGGGSGGGSGGHLVLQSASEIDLSQVTSVSTAQSAGLPPINWGGLFAKGGQGGAGANDLGGARANGTETLPQLDSIGAPNTYPASSAACGVNSTGDYVAGVVGGVANPAQFAFTNSVGLTIAAGGDGGPGIIQLHAPSLSDIVPPAGVNAALRNVCLPLPVGATPANASTPAAWDQLLPDFGRFSVARSKWIALGEPQVAPGSATPDAVTFSFGGTNPATGDVSTIGTHVLELAPIASGVLASPPTLPSISADGRSLLLDGLTVDDLYRRNANLLREFRVRLSNGTPQDFTVGAANYNASSGVLRLTVVESGTPLSGFGAGASFALIPRFFAAGEGADADELSSAIRIRFQAAPADASGGPDAAGASAFVSDIAQLNVAGSPWRFLRFQVLFDLAPAGQPLTPSQPAPYLDFLRIPMRF